MTYLERYNQIRLENGLEKADLYPCLEQVFDRKSRMCMLDCEICWLDEWNGEKTKYEKHVLQHRRRAK